MKRPRLIMLLPAAALMAGIASNHAGCSRKPGAGGTAPPQTDGAAASPGPSGSTAPALSERDKIEGLLRALAASDAVFIRNGGEHGGAEAADHLRMKWSAAGDRVRTAREFIDTIASGSSTSGRPYQVRTADGATIESREWFGKLLEPLESPDERPTQRSEPITAAPVPDPTPEQILSLIRRSDAVFLVVESDETERHSGASLARRIDLKWDLAGRPRSTSTAFIDDFCTRSVLHGTEYKVRAGDGNEVRLADWLREEIRRAPTAR